MKRRQAFETMFQEGMDYDAYISRSEYHLKRMENSWKATEEYLHQIESEILSKINIPLKVMCIAENWCGDCGNGVPVIASMARQMDNWQFKIAARDDYDQLVEEYYTTAGRKKIPVVVFADEDGDEINRWIERPKESYQQLAQLKSQNLAKEEYTEKYNTLPQLRPPEVSKNIADELLEVASKTTSMLKILPKKREPKSEQH